MIVIIPLTLKIFQLIGHIIDASNIILHNKKYKIEILFYFLFKLY